MELRRPKGVLFDIGGTLLREESYGFRARGFAEFIERAHHPRTARNSAVAAIEELEASIDRVHRENHPEFRVADWIERQFETTSAQHRERLEVEMFAEVAKLSPMPDAAKALAELAANGVAMGAVSNAVFGGGSLSAELARHGLLAPLQFVVSSADFGVRKPSAGIFEHALSTLGMATDEVWFVGDSWPNDVLGASGVGMVAVWFNPDGVEAGEETNRCSGRIESWLEFVALYRGAKR